MSLSWDDEDIEMMQDDCLRFLKIVFLDIPLHRLSKIYTIILLGIHIPLAVVQYYYFFKTFDKAMLVQYGPHSLIMAYACLSALVPLFHEKLIHNFILKLRLISWSIDTGSEDMQQKLRKVALYVTNYAKVSLLLGVVTYISVIMKYRSNKGWEIFYQVTFFKEHFPDQTHILIPIFYASMVYFILPMISAFYILAYFTLHLYFQSALVLERIERITDNFTEDIRLVGDEQYQRQVFHRLRFCVKRYGDLKQLALLCIGNIPEVIVIYMVLSFILIFSYVSAWYLDPDKYYPLIVMLCIVSCQVGLIVAEIGQLTDGENERLYETLISLPWYTFNAKNQKIFLLFIGYASKTFSMSPYKSFPVNRRLIVQLYKVFSSVSALLTNTRHNN